MSKTYRRENPEHAKHLRRAGKKIQNKRSRLTGKRETARVTGDFA